MERHKETVAENNTHDSGYVRAERARRTDALAVASLA
jgi:hypothetical protein